LLDRLILLHPGSNTTPAPERLLVSDPTEARAGTVGGCSYPCSLCERRGSCDSYPYAPAPGRGSALNVNGRLQAGTARLVAANISVR